MTDAEKPYGAPKKIEKKDDVKWYVHLANGDVVSMSQKERDEMTHLPIAYRKDDLEHHVIGIYPAEVKLEDS